MKKMNLLMVTLLCGFSILAIAAQSNATVYVEDFEAQFPAWESGWLGTNSNLQNYYGIGQGRGNNPDGLWLTDGGDSTSTNIVFNPVFGATIGSFSIDVATWINTTLSIYDMSDNLLFSTSVSPNQGAYTDPGTYWHYSVNSSNGVSRFAFVGGGIEGNTSIDNVVVDTNAHATTVPEPGTWLLVGSGLAGLAAFRKRFARK